MALLDGIKVNLRGREFTIPPLTLDAYERLWPQIEAMEKASPPEAFSTMRDVIHAAVSENYPDLTLGDLRALLDVANVGPTFTAVLARTGQNKPEGEAKGP